MRFGLPFPWNVAGPSKRFGLAHSLGMCRPKQAFRLVAYRVLKKLFFTLSAATGVVRTDTIQMVYIITGSIARREKSRCWDFSSAC
jgi:hypothetical protein